MRKPKDNTMSETRKTLGLSVTEMADLLGVHLMTYRKWESGERAPNAAAVKAAQTYRWLNSNHPAVFNSYIKKALTE
jgi:transcriptional regulator with XRE-family HTH domain